MIWGNSFTRWFSLCKTLCYRLHWKSWFFVSICELIVANITISLYNERERGYFFWNCVQTCAQKFHTVQKYCTTSIV